MLTGPGFSTSSVEECMVNMRVDVQDWLFSNLQAMVL